MYTRRSRAFAKMGKLWKIHFRNVTAPIPYFVETYIDNGYTDMWKLMKTLVEVDFRGNLIADHVPAMAGGRNTAGRTVWAISAPSMLPHRMEKVASDVLRAADRERS